MSKRKYLVKLVNGSQTPLSELGIEGEVCLVATVVNKENLFTQFDPQTGEKVKVTNLQNVRPIMWHSVFLEDRMHDWNVKGKGIFYYHPHSSAKGDVMEVLIETEIE